MPTYLFKNRAGLYVPRGVALNLKGQKYFTDKRSGAYEFTGNEKDAEKKRGEFARKLNVQIIMQEV